LVQKAFCVNSKALAGRNCEAHPLNEEDISETKDPKNDKKVYLVDFDRQKRRSAEEINRYSGAYVTGDLEVGVLDRYFGTRSIEQPSLSLWRYLLRNKKTGKISMTNNNIGVNQTKQFGKDIATQLGLPNPERYTGHWARTSTINCGIENGGTVEQLMALTGKLYVFKIMLTIIMLCRS
jgi:hypothetical protein